MANLISKAKELKKEGLSAYVYTGSYQVPVRTLTGDLMKDIMVIDEVSKRHITFSSDAQGSLPCFDENRKLEGHLLYMSQLEKPLWS